MIVAVVAVGHEGVPADLGVPALGLDVHAGPELVQVTAPSGGRSVPERQRKSMNRESLWAKNSSFLPFSAPCHSTPPPMANASHQVIRGSGASCRRAATDSANSAN